MNGENLKVMCQRCGKDMWIIVFPDGRIKGCECQYCGEMGLFLLPINLPVKNNLATLNSQTTTKLK